MAYLYSIVDKVFFVILLMAMGVLAKRMNLLSDQGEKEFGRLSIDFVWPCMIFSSITTKLTGDEILANLWLPALSIAIHVVGYAVGLAFCKRTRYQGDRRRIFLFHAAMNNFLVMVIPFVQHFFPEKGIALLSMANLGSIVALWTLGVSILVGKADTRETLKNIVSPGMIAILAAMVFVFTGLNRLVPKIAADALETAGQSTLFMGLFLAGTQIYKLGRNALKFDAWNLYIGLIRNVLVPAIMFGLCLALSGRVGKETLAVIMLVSITPASVTSVPLALKHGTSATLAAEGVIFTHILAVVTMPCFVMLVDAFL